MEVEMWEAHSNPFEGVPGIRAAFFRNLVRFTQYLDRTREDDEARAKLHHDIRQRRLDWNREHSSRLANRMVDLYLLLVVAFALFVFGGDIGNPTEPGKPIPEHRTHVPFGRA